MDKKERLNAIINYYSDGKPTVFAKALGVAPSTISSWLSRNVLDYDLIFAKCEMISAHWLLTGEGKMLKSATDEHPSNPKDKERIEQLEAQIKVLEALEPLSDTIVKEVIVHKSDPRDTIAIETSKELILAKTDTINIQKELIASLKDRIKDLEKSSGKSSTAFRSAQSVASTGKRYQDKCIK